jgi:hypothetical protein
MFGMSNFFLFFWILQTFAYQSLRKRSRIHRTVLSEGEAKRKYLTYEHIFTILLEDELRKKFKDSEGGNFSYENIFYDDEHRDQRMIYEFFGLFTGREEKVCN